MTPLLIALLSMPDARYLTDQAQRWGIDPRVVLAIAWEETRNNVDPTVRGQAGEVGRFQISRARAHRDCRGLRIERYHDNVTCFFRSFSADMIRHDLPGLLPLNAIRRYNGSGPKARAYTARILHIIRQL